MLAKQLEVSLKVSVQWVTALLRVGYRLYQGKLDEETGELALLTLLLLAAVWIEGAKLWTLAAYQCYNLGKEVRRKLTSSSSVQEQAQQQVTPPEDTEVAEEGNITPIINPTDTVSALDGRSVDVTPRTVPIRVSIGSLSFTSTHQQDNENSSSSSPQPLHCLTSKTLKQLAKERRIKGYGRMTKAQLVAALSC